MKLFVLLLSTSLYTFTMNPFEYEDSEWESMLNTLAEKPFVELSLDIQEIAIMRAISNKDLESIKEYSDEMHDKQFTSSTKKTILSVLQDLNDPAMTQQILNILSKHGVSVKQKIS